MKSIMIRSSIVSDNEHHFELLGSLIDISSMDKFASHDFFSVKNFSVMGVSFVDIIMWFRVVNFGALVYDILGFKILKKIKVNKLQFAFFWWTRSKTIPSLAASCAILCKANVCFRLERIRAFFNWTRSNTFPSHRAFSAILTCHLKVF